MLVTSRETRRWIVPKGNLIRGLSLAEAAAQEAWEEGGIRGVVWPDAIGRYTYAKRRRCGRTDQVEASLFPLAVEREVGEWPERKERERRWFTRSEAVAAVGDPALGALIAAFHPSARATPVIRA